jgi:hypothetical protein
MGCFFGDQHLPHTVDWKAFAFCNNSEVRPFTGLAESIENE